MDRGRRSWGSANGQFRTRFDVDSMVTGYEEIYRGAILDRLPVRPDDLVRAAVRRVVRTPAAA